MGFVRHHQDTVQIRVRYAYPLCVWCLQVRVLVRCGNSRPAEYLCRTLASGGQFLPNHTFLKFMQRNY